jgi:hypothetical protein
MKMNSEQVNRLTTMSAAGSLAGVTIGIIGHITIGGAVGSVFLGAGTVIGTAVGGAIGYAAVAYSAKHAKHPQANPLSDTATDQTFPT